MTSTQWTSSWSIEKPEQRPGSCSCFFCCWLWTSREQFHNVSMALRIGKLFAQVLASDVSKRLGYKWVKVFKNGPSNTLTQMETVVSARSPLHCNSRRFANIFIWFWIWTLQLISSYHFFSFDNTELKRRRVSYSRVFTYY